MNIRKFSRKINKGIMTSSNALQTLYCKGDKTLTQPSHHTIIALVNKGYAILIKPDTLSITKAGKKYIRKNFPNLQEFVPEDDNESRIRREVRNTIQYGTRPGRCIQRPD